jgi:hypothetical protein
MSTTKEEVVAAATELGYMQRRATEMVWQVVNLCEDHRVCMLGRKIETLQAQDYGLEIRNCECHTLVESEPFVRALVPVQL